MRYNADELIEDFDFAGVLVISYNVQGDERMEYNRQFFDKHDVATVSLQRFLDMGDGSNPSISSRPVFFR